MKTTKRESINKTLNLPSTYRTHIRIEGNDFITSPAEPKFLELRVLTSPTLGHVPVYAKAESYGEWREVSRAHWKKELARLSLNDQ